MTELRMSRAGAAYIALRGYISWIINLIWAISFCLLTSSKRMSKCRPVLSANRLNINFDDKRTTLIPQSTKD
jgi:hypothetical protein